MAVAENERTGPRFVKWKPRPEIAHEPDAAPATAAEENNASAHDTGGFRRGRLMTPESTRVTL
jgi:hypothetical protein